MKKVAPFFLVIMFTPGVMVSEMAHFLHFLLTTAKY